MKTPTKLKQNFKIQLSKAKPKLASFAKYQRTRFWTNFDEGLYNRICEIKMQEI